MGALKNYSLRERLISNDNTVDVINSELKLNQIDLEYTTDNLKHILQNDHIPDYIKSELIIYFTDYKYKKEKPKELDWSHYDIKLFREKYKNNIDGLSEHLKVEISYLSGIDFEKWISERFAINGSKPEQTKISGDFGVDLVLSFDEIKFAIQLKNHNDSIGVSGVQEISAGKIHYECDFAVLISKSGFTRPAVELARSNKVKLLDLQKLSELFLKGPQFLKD